MLFIVAAGAKPANQTNNNSPPVHVCMYVCTYVSVLLHVGMFVHTYLCMYASGPSNQLLANCCAVIHRFPNVFT